MTNKKTALVLGATGGIGGEVAARLRLEGWEVVALTRNTSSLSDSNRRSGYRWIQGDSMKRSDVVSAAKGAQLIVHAVNPPGYKNWEQQSIPMLENTIEAAKASRARILFPGTLYNFGPETPQPLTENSEQKTHTKKGQIRIRMEELLKKASSEGAPVLIVRAGDFFGPHPGNNWFSQGLIKPGALIRTINYPGKRGVGHSWAYLPDLAETMVKLVEQEGRLSAFEVFHFEGQWDNDGTQMIDAIIRASGRSDVKVRRMPWIVLRLLSPFVTLFKEMLEVQYLWEQGFRMENKRLVNFLGNEPRTPLDQAVSKTIQTLGCLS